jgi:hypothetical protein
VTIEELTRELILLARLRELVPEPKGNRVLIGRLVSGIRRETVRSTHGQGEALIISRSRPEHVAVAKACDELWVVVKCQSSSEIARSPRNVFRYSLRDSLGR